MKPAIDHLKPYEPGKPIEAVKADYGLKEVIKLASNENAHGTSTAVKEAITREGGLTHLYPDGHATELRKAVADYLEVDEGQLLFGAGSDEIILMLCRSLLFSGTNTITAAPTFSQYKHNAVIEGAETIEVPLDDQGVHDLDAMLAAVTAQTKIIWVCNPNNPTGTYISEDAFQRFMEKVPENVLVVSDEAYVEYVAASDFPDTLSLLRQYENLLILRTFSKMYGLAGLRIGYGIGNRKLISKLESLRPPFNTTKMAQAAGIAALQDQAFVRKCYVTNHEEKQKLEHFFNEQGYSYYSSETNFLLADIGTNGDEVFKFLLSKGVIVRSGEALGFSNCIRISVGTERENESFMQAFLAWKNQHA